jgi:hypothetical protein
MTDRSPNDDPGGTVSSANEPVDARSLVGA